MTDLGRGSRAAWVPWVAAWVQVLGVSWVLGPSLGLPRAAASHLSADMLLLLPHWHLRPTTTTPTLTTRRPLEIYRSGTLAVRDIRCVYTDTLRRRAHPPTTRRSLPPRSPAACDWLAGSPSSPPRPRRSPSLLHSSPFLPFFFVSFSFSPSSPSSSPRATDSHSTVQHHPVPSSPQAPPTLLQRGNSRVSPSFLFASRVSPSP